VQCIPETQSMCVARYTLPCTVAADCGAGFSCEEQQSCGCAGSGGSARRPAPDADFPEGAAGSPDAEAPADPLPPECSCEPSGVFACIPQEILCDEASDCPTGWLCQQENQGEVPACAGDGCPTPQPQPPARFLCQPEYGGAVGVDAGGVPTSGGPKGGTGTGSPEASPTPTGNSSGDESRESAACQMGHAPASSGVLSLLAVLGALVGLRRRRA
jgi:hypothetical protein